MKKTLSLIVCVILLAFFTGCGSLNKIKSKMPTTNKATTDTTDSKITKSDLKIIDDNQLIAASKEQSPVLSDISIEDEDISSLDSVLKDTDPISDIPQTVELKK